MSEKAETLIIDPPIGMAYESARTEKLQTNIYRCTVCGGDGGKYIDSRSYSYDPAKGESYYEACKMCKGSGKIKGLITIEWKTTGEIKKEAII